MIKVQCTVGKNTVYKRYEVQALINSKIQCISKYPLIDSLLLQFNIVGMDGWCDDAG